MTWFQRFVAPALGGAAYVLAVSVAPEPARQRLHAVVLAGAGAAYLSGGGTGLVELPFTASVTGCAYLGLRDYRWLGVGWLLHTGWDLVHHRRAAPILPRFADSSLGCAICDPVIALYLFRGAPDLLPAPCALGREAAHAEVVRG